MRKEKIYKCLTFSEKTYVMNIKEISEITEITKEEVRNIKYDL